jgi:hypothetical protein
MENLPINSHTCCCCSTLSARVLYVLHLLTSQIPQDNATLLALKRFILNIKRKKKEIIYVSSAIFTISDVLSSFLWTTFPPESSLQPKEFSLAFVQCRYAGNELSFT